MKRAMVFSAACALCLASAAHTTVTNGHWKTFTYDKPDMTPVVFGGWSCAEGVKARDYCVYLDMLHPDGSKTSGKRAHWRQGTHGWEETREVFLPKKPISRIEAFVFNRAGVGKAKFRDVYLERRNGRGERMKEVRMSFKPFADGDVVSYDLFKGSTIKRIDERVAAEISFPPPPDGVTVWTADSMEKITPLARPPADAKRIISLSLVRRERESAQVLVSCGADSELAGVTLEIGRLKDASGRVLDGDVKWERVGYVPRKGGYLPHPAGLDTKEMWLPDPLLPAAPFKVRRTSTQGAWITVFAAPGAKPGAYRSEVRVMHDGKTLASIPLSVKVLDFALGKTFALDTAFSLMDGFMRAEYPEKWREMKRQAIDVMLDHRLNPDDITRTTPPEIDDLLHAKARGMSRFNILNIVPEAKPGARWVCIAKPQEVFSEEFYRTFTARLRPYLDKLKANGLDRMAYIYGFDERKAEYYVGIDKMWKRLKADFSDLPMMTTAKMFRDIVKGATNGFDCVTTDWYCPVSSDYDEKVADWLRALGKKVWWYTCGSPTYPYANMASLEYPLIEGRLVVGILTWLCHADGFLFWHVNNWRDGNDPMDESDTYFPEWNTRHYRGVSGNGIFLYPGKDHILPSIRLANIRDGEEDYELLLHAEKRLGRKAVEEMVRTVVRSTTDFSRDPAVLTALRDRLSER